MHRISFLFLLLTFCKPAIDKKLLLLQSILEEKQIKYMFTDPYDYENNVKIQNQIVEIIQNSKKEIYIFCYGLDDEKIINAILNAYNRGIQIKIIGSPDQNYEQLIHLGIPYEIRQQSNLQHIKMILSDRTHLLSGTGNFTKSDIFYSSNLFFQLQIPENIGNLIIKKFYQLNYDHPIIIHNEFYKIKILQSPKNGVSIQSILTNAILNAKESVHFFIYHFYDPVLMNSLNYKSNQILITGIVDSINLKKDNDFLNKLLQTDSNLWIYQENYQTTYLDQNFNSRGGKLHHKTLIIDDKLYTGSFNFSLNARDSNSEIFFEIYDPYQIHNLKKQYQKIFNHSSLIIKNKNIPIPNDTYIANLNFCMQTQGDGFYFSNKNAFFFMEYINNSDCPTLRNAYSTGIVSNPSDGFFYHNGISTKNFMNPKTLFFNNSMLSEYLNNCTSIFCDFCENFHCDFFKILFFNPSAKVFVSTLDFLSGEFLIWNGKQILKGKVVQKIFNEDKFYYQFKAYTINEVFFSGSLEELIIFFRQNDFLYIGCVQKNQLRKNLFTFLTLYEWYSEKIYDWKQICYYIE